MSRTGVGSGVLDHLRQDVFAVRSRDGGLPLTGRDSMVTTDDTKTEEPPRGHIRGQNRPDLDVYLNGERMIEHDAVDEGIVMTHSGRDRVVQITVIYTDGLHVDGMVWDDPTNAHDTQGADVHFDRVGDDGDVFARFEARTRDLTVGLREVRAEDA